MMEKVRLHPLLITETKESELNRARWMGLETHQLILECAKLCLDPIEATCEDVSGSFFTCNQGSDLASDSSPLPTNWLLYSLEKNFWSPSLSLPSSLLSSQIGSSSSVPHTPVYPISSPNLRLVGKVAESPPEAAIEATPETTPFTSPMKMEASNVSTRQPVDVKCALTLNTDICKNNQAIQATDLEVTSSPLSPVKKEQTPFKFPDDQSQNLFSRVERSTLLQSKLQQILKERQQIQKENNKPLENKNDSEGIDIDTKDVKEIKESVVIIRKTLGEKNVRDTAAENEFEPKGDICSPQPDQGNRRRKVSMYDGTQNIDLKKLGIPVDQFASGNSDLNFSNEAALKSEIDRDQNYTTSLIDRRISEERESEGSESRKSSDETRVCENINIEESENLGLGVPTQRSMTDLVKNMRKMRLRFLSQCGPPPDLSQYNLVGRAALSPTKVNGSSNAHMRSLSCPDLSVDGSVQTPCANERKVRKVSAVSSLTLSPVRQAIVTSEASTQTEEITVVNPYEQLLGALVAGPTSYQPKNSDTNMNDSNFSSPSPYELLDQYLRFGAEVGEEAETILWQPTNQTEGNEVWKNQIRLMQILLLVERYRRDVHAERNRRLLGREKKAFTLEHQQRELKMKISQYQGEILNLNHEIKNLQSLAANKEQQLQQALSQEQVKVTKVLVERDEAQKDRGLLKKQCEALSRENESLNIQLKEAQTALLEKDRQLTCQAHLADENDVFRNQVETLQKQLILMGEMKERYQQEVWRLTLSGSPGTMRRMELERATSLEQVQELEEKCRVATASLDAAHSRVIQLEFKLSEKNKQIEEQQNSVKAAREAGAEECRAIELRCQALVSSNQTLEGFILKQNDRIDKLSRQVRRSQRGKSVCSDGLDFDLELSVSPAGPSSLAMSPPDDLLYPTGSLLARQSQVLTKLDALVGQEIEPEGYSRRKT